MRVYENVSRDTAQKKRGIPSCSVSGRRCVEIRVKNTPLVCMINNFKKGFNGDNRVKLTLNKLKVLCEVDWPAFG
jgi:hypothetical protein